MKSSTLFTLANMLLQLNPPIPFITDDGKKVTALFLLDYSQEHESLFLVAYEDSRELWRVSQKKLRMQDNVSLGRLPK